MKYVPEKKKYFDADKIPQCLKAISISGTEVRRRLLSGEHIPEWFSHPNVVKILRASTLSNNCGVWNKEYESKAPQDIIHKALEEFGDDVAISFSGAEDVLLIEMAHRTGLPYRVFTLDTGRVFPETYELMNEVEKKYDITIECCFPDTQEVQNLVDSKGMFSF